MSPTCDADDFIFIWPHEKVSLCWMCADKQERDTEEAESERWSPAAAAWWALLQRRCWLGPPAASWRLLAGACSLHRGESIQSCAHVSTGRTTSRVQTSSGCSAPSEESHMFIKRQLGRKTSVMFKSLIMSWEYIVILTLCIVCEDIYYSYHANQLAQPGAQVAWTPTLPWAPELPSSCTANWANELTAATIEEPPSTCASSGKD